MMTRFCSFVGGSQSRVCFATQATCRVFKNTRLPRFAAETHYQISNKSPMQLTPLPKWPTVGAGGSSRRVSGARGSSFLFVSRASAHGLERRWGERSRSGCCSNTSCGRRRQAVPYEKDIVVVRQPSSPESRKRSLRHETPARLRSPPERQQYRPRQLWNSLVTECPTTAPPEPRARSRAAPRCSGAGASAEGDAPLASASFSRFERGSANDADADNSRRHAAEESRSALIGSDAISLTQRNNDANKSLLTNRHGSSANVNSTNYSEYSGLMPLSDKATSVKTLDVERGFVLDVERAQHFLTTIPQPSKPSKKSRGRSRATSGRTK